MAMKAMKINNEKRNEKRKYGSNNMKETSNNQ
jgi:hypothetical protein